MKARSLFLFLFTSVAACEVIDELPVSETATINEIKTYFNGNNAFVYTVDEQFTTGAAAIVSLDEPFKVLKTGIGEGDWFSTDVMFQSDNRYVYIIDRTNGNITVVDPLDDGKELKQISVGPTSNPKGAVGIDNKIFVSRWSSPSMLVLDATTFQEKGEIDLSEFSDADGNPEMGLAVTAEGRVWVALERYLLPSYSPSTEPVEGGYLVSINPETEKIEKRVKLLGVTPWQLLKIDPLNGNLLVTSSLAFATGIESVDPKTGESKGWLVDPAKFPNGINFAAATTSHVYVVSGDGAYDSVIYDYEYTVLWAIDRETEEMTEVYRTAEGYKGIACLELSPGTTRAPGKRLLITCAGPSIKVTSPGLRIFDPVTLKQLTNKPLNTGLPPFGVAFFARPETETVSQ